MILHTIMLSQLLQTNLSDSLILLGNSTCLQIHLVLGIVCSKNTLLLGTVLVVYMNKKLSITVMSLTFQPW